MSTYTSTASQDVPSADSILLGRGKIYKDYDEVGETELGATQGGSVFALERVIKEIEYDGSFGKTKGMRRITRIDAMLTVNMLELTDNNLVDMYCAMSATPLSGYDQITQSLDISDNEYFTNIAFVGQTLGGKKIEIIIENALGDGNLTWNLNKEDEVVSECVFSMHFDGSNPTTVPVKINIYTS